MVQTCQLKAVGSKQKFWDFADLKYNRSWDLPTYDELHLGRIFCYYILMRIIFYEVIFSTMLLWMNYELSLVMYGFCSNNALYSASIAFMVFIFLLTPFDAWIFNLNKISAQCCSWKCFSQKKHVKLFCSSLSLKKYLSLMSLFLCLSRISLSVSGHIKSGGFGKKMKREGQPYRWVVYWREFNLFAHYAALVKTLIWHR